MVNYTAIIFKPDENRAIVKNRCPECGKERQLEVTVRQGRMLKDVHDGVSKTQIQDILPLDIFTDSEREICMTGICDACWDKLFPEE